MLTAANVSSEMAVKYFVKNYYHQGKSLWSGQGAEKLGLSGAVDDEDAFKNVIEGMSPDGSQSLNGRMLKEKGKERRAALDCTFSAPKSVSLMALVGGDPRLIDAHHQALKETIELIEQRYAYTRVTDDNGRHRIKTGNLVVAQFDHIESRDLDPHLHTHCLLMNMTQTPDGRWLSLGNNEIFANKKFLGMAYQSYLAREVQKLGYEIEPRKHGQFDIKGFKEEDLEAFSKRRQQILAKAGVNSTWAEREKIWDQTRQRKEKLPESVLKAYWSEEAQALGITFVKPGEPKQGAEVDDQSLAAALGNAIAHCSERNVAFKLEELEKFILEERLATDVTAIEPLVREHQELISLPGLTHQFTTMAAVRRELATIDLMQQGQGKVNPISHPEVVESLLNNTLLNQGQREAVELATLTQDQFIAWQGVAGAGKTFALKELKALAELNAVIAANSGYTIKGFAPSSTAAKVLSEELEIQSETVARLLVSESPPEIEPNQIWIVDEAGLLSAKDAHALLQRANLEQARILFVGDTRQLSAVEAGNPFKSLQQAGIKTAHLNESLRQKNPQLKLAVDLIAEGRTKAGFEHLSANGSIKTVDVESKIEAIASDYILGTPLQRLKTLVLAGTNTERLALTQAIRGKLKDEGSLGDTATITQLQAKNLSKVQMQFAHNFELGDVIMPTRNYKRRGLSKGKLYEVVGQNTDKLTLIGDDSQVLEVDTAFDSAVYQRNQIEIAVGDRLQWKKNDRQLGRRNGQEFTVTGIDSNLVHIKYDDERTESISLAQAQTLDYALVSTTYSSQGKTADRVLISADFTIGQESFYVAASRAKHELKIYTEDPMKLVALAQESRAKENALELLRQQAQEQKQVVAVAAAPVKTTVAPSTPVVAPVLKRVVEEKDQEPKEVKVFEKPILKSKPEIFIPTEPFWNPAIGEPAPNHIEKEHWKELVEKSAIHPQIAALNFESLHFNYVGGEHEAWERLMISEKLERTNTGRLKEGFIQAYSHLDAGGWWCDAGVDPRKFADLHSESQPDKKLWGCYKPNQPRPKKNHDNQIIDGKFIKYEHPPKVELSIFLLDVPPDIAEHIYQKSGISPSDSDGGTPSVADRNSGFWYCVWKYNLPVTITEGAKKAASLLSQGHAAIGLPGISAGYRSPKDEYGQKIGKSYLNKELAVFATPNREIKFCFDYETKPETIVNIKRDISTTGWLLHQQGCSVKVVTLPGPDKGVDDFLVAQGALAYETVNYEARSLRDWQYHNRQQQKTAYQPPRKLTPEEVQHKLATSPNSPIKEPDHDNHQQPQQSTTRRNSNVNREDQPIVEQPGATFHQNRATGNSPSTVDSENRAVVNEPNPKPERVEDKSHELLTAISRYIEQQAVEQFEADFREFNRSLTSSELRGQRRADIPGNAHQLDSASPDSPTSDVNLKPDTNERVINAISDFLEITEIAEAIDLEGLQTKIRHSLLPGQPQTKAIAPETTQKTMEAIANFVEREEISSILVEALPRLIQELSQYQQDLVKGAITLDQLTSAIAEQQKQQLSQKAVDAIVNYIEQSSIESALVNLPTVIKKLSESQSNTEFTNTIKKLKPVFDKLNTLQQKAAEKEKLITDLRLLLKQKIQSLEKSELIPLFREIARYASCEESKGEEVKKLFSSVGQADFPLNFQQRMDLVRLLIREDKARIIKELDPGQDNGQQRGFRR
ncbi:relaxase domain-containing protein [Nostoc sp. LEGE 06077]|uniref:MobF family relaxase n=1 Tax=Nostoc sp. LEGE 06077 TaxID=915325 RepID=UPI001881FFCF|nr:MobF family relaxase [Nostoc sp. LEGE 06077]MBE9210538.1 relaxase domain-containing protein [Nostoc sp. LEGE 06077]